jgi:hypothetical protein
MSERIMEKWEKTTIPKNKVVAMIRQTLNE